MLPACPQLLAVSWGSHRPGVALPRLLLQKSFLPLLTKPKADHLGSCKTIQMQNKMLLKTVPQIAKHLIKPGHGLKKIKIMWMPFVKMVLRQEGSKQLTTQKCHRCTRECLSIILFIPACKSRRDCQILCCDSSLCCHHCTSLREPGLSPAAPAGFWFVSPEELSHSSLRKEGRERKCALVLQELDCDLWGRGRQEISDPWLFHLDINFFLTSDQVNA